LSDAYDTTDRPDDAGPEYRCDIVLDRFT